MLVVDVLSVWRVVGVYFVKGLTSGDGACKLLLSVGKDMETHAVEAGSQ